MSLSFTPVVLSEGRISLHLATEVTEVDLASTFTYNNVSVPGFKTRKNETTIELPSGASIATAGLLGQASAAGISGVPGFPKSFGGRVDSSSLGRLRAFGRKYAEFGDGPVEMSVPVGSYGDKSRDRPDYSGLRRALSAEGVRDVRIVEYPVVDPKMAAPVRLSFNGLKAKVADRCGLWPEDLASGTSLSGWQNQSYWNFGCSTQNMIATQAADPRDLVSPRGSTPADIEMRMRGIRSEDVWTRCRLNARDVADNAELTP